MQSTFQQYCDVTESMAFKSSEINSNSSNNTSPQKIKTNSKFKCFNCFGVNNSQSYCVHCGGTNYIIDSHPLALLLNQVFERKFGKNQFQSSKQAGWNDFEDVEAIRQEQEQLDQRKIICDICAEQCDINYKYYCQCCLCFYVCEQCANTKGDQIDHQHPLATNKIFKQVNLKKTNSKKLSSNKKSNYISSEDQDFPVTNEYQQQQKKQQTNKSSKDLIRDFIDTIPHYSRVLDDVGIEVRQSFDFIECQEDILRKSHGNRQSMEFGQSNQIRQSFGFPQGTFQEELCQNCQAQLNDIFGICKTCQKNNINYKICTQCFDKKNYNHQKSHQVDTALGNLFGRKSEFIPKQVYQSQDDDLPKPFLSRKSSSLDKIQIPHYQSQHSGKKSFGKIKYAQSMENSGALPYQSKLKCKQFDEESRVNVDCGSLYSSSQLKDQLQAPNLVQKKSSLYEVNNSIEITQKFKQIDQKKKNTISKALLQLKQDDEIRISYVYSEQMSSEDEKSPFFLHNTKNKFKQRFKNKSNSRSKSKEQIINLGKKLRSSKSNVSFTEQKQIRSSNSIVHDLSIIQQRNKAKKCQNDYKQQQFIFYQYNCNQCGCQPIKNIRFHCTKCQDFDVCAECYTQEFLYRHTHEFEKIDGAKRMREQTALMVKRKDLNKIRDSMLKSTNNTSVSMQSKSKKTIELIKGKVNYLNSSVNSLVKAIKGIESSNIRTTYVSKSNYI